MPSTQQTSMTPSEERDLWRTPRYVFDYWSKYIGGFDVDLAADQNNALCKLFVDARINALEAEWISYGKVGWCNPPYSDVGSWVRKAAYEAGANRFTTVLLVPTFNGDKYHYLYTREFAETWLICGRVSFLRPNGKAVKGNRAGSMVCIFGPKVKAGVIHWLHRDDMMRATGEDLV